MLLSEIIEKMYLKEEDVFNFSDVDITGISDLSSSVKRGYVFVARKGKSKDGNSYIKEAIKKGAACIVTDDITKTKQFKNAIFSKNPRKTMAEISKIVYGDPKNKIKIIGITGTKGKSTTAEFLRCSLEYAGFPTLLIGTLGVIGAKGDNLKINNTTPTSPIIYELLSQAVSSDIKYAIIEVSSQALTDYRVWGISFDTVIYTGFSYDHIGVGEHKNLKEYFNAKRRLFTDYGAECAVVYDDGEQSRKISFGVESIIRCGEELYDEYYISGVFTSPPGVGFTLFGHDYRIGIPGKYNVINATLALATAVRLTGYSPESFSGALPTVRVRGRFEVYELSGRTVIIDFAHNFESVKNTCLEARRLSLGRLITVFGSVGERAYERRREIAIAAEEYSDFSVITSDNPGSENPREICENIRSYFKNQRRAVIIPDRKEAIRHALELSEAGDYVLLLGKGHEDYQLIGNRRLRFSERELLLSMGAKASG